MEKRRAGGQALEFVAVGGELGGLGGDVLAGKPFLEAALAPVGEVLLADGVAVEVFGEDFLDFRQGIEPADDLLAFRAVLEAGVESECPRATGRFFRCEP